MYENEDTLTITKEMIECTIGSANFLVVHNV